MSIEPLFLWCGVLAGSLFIIVFLIEGMLRTGYQPLRQPVSALAMGSRGWVQRINFIITGALMLPFSIGLSVSLRAYGGSFWAPVLVGIYALGLIGAGVFVTDITGMPKTNPGMPKRAVSGVLHDICSLFVFIPLFLAFFVFQQLFVEAGMYGWAIYSATSGLLFGLGFLLFARSFATEGALAPVGGLIQRITIATGWLWLSLVAAHLVGVI
ncbi:MAG: hypothetical protein JWO50_803 [Candidatus Kaiserbacteria bacterium]|nr:hypothetical protein [Candidatus Kaiserbacteria bacterium]